MKKPQKSVKYKVTHPFGTLSKGDVIDAYVLLKDLDNGCVVLYHPPSKDECGTIEIARPQGDVYVGMHASAYINLKQSTAKLVEHLFWTVLPKLKIRP